MPRLVKNGLVYGGSSNTDTTFDTTSDNPIANSTVATIVGDTDISGVGDGTITGAIDALSEGSAELTTITYSTWQSYSDEQKAAFVGYVSGVPNQALNASSIAYGNTTVGAELTQINADLSDIWKVIYPVGSLYMSVNNTDPSTLFGGTWSMLTGGYVLKTISSGTGGSTNTAGNTGNTTLTAAQSGSRAHYHTPGTLSASSAGAHTHKGYYHLAPMSGNNGYPLCESNASGAAQSMTITTSNGAHTHPITGATEYNTNENATEAHNHTAGMPQNIGVYVWKRTA